MITVKLEKKSRMNEYLLNYMWFKILIKFQINILSQHLDLDI